MVGWKRLEIASGKRLEDAYGKRSKESQRREWDRLDGISITFMEERDLSHEGVENKYH